MRHEQGFVLLGVLVALAVVALLAVEFGQRAGDRRQRDAEEELLDAGREMRQAIESYWRASPGGVRTLPTRLEDLLLDPRFAQPQRHLRRLLRDPLPPHRPWGVIRQGRGIVGVYSQADGTPFRRTGFGPAEAGFDTARSYADWRFVFMVPARVPVTPVLKEQR